MHLAENFEAVDDVIFADNALAEETDGKQICIQTDRQTDRQHVCSRRTTKYCGIERNV